MTRKTTRKVTLVAVVAMLAMGTSMALAVGPGSHATTDSSAVAAQETTTTAAEETTTVAETANVTFTNQTSNGTAVVVERVVVPEGGFVVIHAAQNATAGNATETTPAEDGTETETETETGTETEAGMETETAADGAGQQYTAGQVIGNSTYLEPGVHENVTVELSRFLEVGQVLIAMPHRDTNGNQQYEFPEADDPYTQDGQPVTDWASVTLEEGANETTTEGEMDGEDEEETTTEDM